MPKLYIIGSKLNEEKENVILWNEKSKETNNILDIFKRARKNKTRKRRATNHGSGTTEHGSGWTDRVL